MSNPLAFSTLGCPSWSLEQVLAGAKDAGYDAVELRGYQETLDLTQATPFFPENRAATRQRFADSGLAICCVSSSGVVAQGNLDHVKGHCELARDLGSPVVRIFGGTPESEAQAVENLRAFGDAAEEAGVALVLETHDDFSTGARVAALLAAAAHPAVFSLWDLHHPYRQGEAIEATFAALAPSVRHVHVKDSRDGVYTLLGEGDLPAFAMLDRLLAKGYTGAISLEWEKRWHPELAEPEVALLHFAQVMRAYRMSRR